MRGSRGRRVSLVENGVYDVGAILLKSGVEFHLGRNAKLRGSRNPHDYAIALPVTRGPYCAKATNKWSNAILRILDAHDVSVTGEPGSEIDGRNCLDPTGEEKFRGPHAISVFHSTNLLFCGYCVRNAANYGLYVRGSARVKVERVDIEGGHDGFDFFNCEDVEVSGCFIRSGDDCVAGYGNRRLRVRHCSLNSSCSFFRIGGNDILVEECHGEAPAVYPHRWSLSPEERSLERVPDGAGRHTTLAFFTFYTGKAAKGRGSSGIVFRNCRIAGVEQFIHYNLSGNERWQNGPGLADVTFENVRATGMKRPLCVYAPSEMPVDVTFRNCELSFSEPVGELIRGANPGRFSVEGLSVERVNGPFLRSWNGSPDISHRELNGIDPVVVRGEGAFTEPAI